MKEGEEMDENKKNMSTMQEVECEDDLKEIQELLSCVSMECGW